MEEAAQWPPVCEGTAQGWGHRAGEAHSHRQAMGGEVHVAVEGQTLLPPPPLRLLLPLRLEPAVPEARPPSPLLYRRRWLAKRQAPAHPVAAVVAVVVAAVVVRGLGG